MKVLWGLNSAHPRGYSLQLMERYSKPIILRFGISSNQNILQGKALVSVPWNQEWYTHWERDPSIMFMLLWRRVAITVSNLSCFPFLRTLGALRGTWISVTDEVSYLYTLFKFFTRISVPFKSYYTFRKACFPRLASCMVTCIIVFLYCGICGTRGDNYMV